jgi:CBS domain-containing protein
MSHLFHTATIEQLGLVPENNAANIPPFRRFITLPSKTNAMDALLALYNHNTNNSSSEPLKAIAIVDRAGVFKTSFSVSDLRGISEDKMRFLALRVTHFLKLIHAMNIASTPTSSYLPIVASKDDTLKTIMDKLIAQWDMHSQMTDMVWVVDDEHKPIGLITLRDILGIALDVNNERPTA